MKREPSKLIAIAASTCLLTGAIAFAGSQGAGKEGEIAQRIVTQTAGVAEGEVVQIEGTPHDIKLLEALATEVRKRGAFPLVTLTTDEMERRSFTEVPAKYDSQERKLELALADVVDVGIFVGSTQSPDLLADVPDIATRRSAREKAFEPVFKKWAESNRFVEVNNGLYPTAWRAKRYGMSEEELARMFWQGVNVDYSDLQTRGEAIRNSLARAKEMRIRAGNGTDLKLRIEGRPIVVSDGVLSDEDRERGGTARWSYLPAGEVALTPVPGSAQGKVVFNRLFYDGKEVLDLTLTFAKGQMTAMSGSGPGYASLKAHHDAAADPRKTELGFVDLGINENLQLPKDSAVGTWPPAGTTTVGIGSNVWAGGDNGSTYGLAGHLRDATVTVDATTLVKNGELQATTRVAEKQ